MLNEFQFSFSTSDIRELISNGGDRIIVTGKVVYDPKSKTSTFEIYAENDPAPVSANRVPGCPMPC